MISVRECLVTQVDHFVAEQGVRDLLELGVSNLGRLRAAYFRSHGRGERFDVDVPVFRRLVIEFTGRMEPHA